ncbi:MAG: hypothetical protein R6T90_08435 [Dissulfuribacterales bacterium]
MAETKEYGLEPEFVSSHALVVGDPERADKAAGLLSDPETVWNKREYRVFTGDYKGKKVTIASHGVGASGAAVMFERLFKKGVKTIIRAGTCGALVAGVPDGGIIIGTGAIRDDGLSQNMIPMEYPAVSDCQVTQVLQETAQTLNHEISSVGIILTDGLYFPYPYVESKIDMWAELGAVAIEMEFATLLIQASIHKARAGGIFVSDGNVIEEPDPWAVNPDQEVVARGKEKMIEIALEALVKLA